MKQFAVRHASNDGPMSDAHTDQPNGSEPVASPDENDQDGQACKALMVGPQDENEVTGQKLHSEKRDATRLVELSNSFGKIAKRINTLSANITDTSGTVGDVTHSLTEQLSSLTYLLDSVEALDARNQNITSVTGDAIDRATRVRAELAETSQAIEQIFATSADDIKNISQATTKTISEFDEIKSELTMVQEHSIAIQKISTQTRMLAINAGVMATHAGEAGKGFGVVAESVSELAEETASVSNSIIRRLGSLETTIKRLLEHSNQSYHIAEEAKSRSGYIETEFQKFKLFGDDVETLAQSISEMAEPLNENSQACARVNEDLHKLSASSDKSFAQLKATAGQFDDLVSFTESMFLLLEQSGIETDDTPIIRSTMQVAQHICEIFEDAVANRKISMEDLFDSQYEPIKGSDPEQVMTRFTSFTDHVLPDLQEAHLASHERIVFCAAIDKNGYIPTHNLAVSKPQGPDPVWNAANCRNRRIFNDRTGLAAGQNQDPFLMQTYRRDMGGGHFVMMKDLSVPIFVKGRHWGGFRAGVKLS